MVRISPWSILTGAAAVLSVAATTPALAGDGQVHVQTVQLPGGGAERIQYTGDVAPRIVLVPMSPAMPMMQADPFAALERISAMMRQQEAVMLRQVQMLTAAPFAVPEDGGGSPVVSASTGGGVCMRSVRITYTGGDASPKVVSSMSGDCGPVPGAQPSAEVNTPAPMRRTVPSTIEVKATGQTPGGAPPRQVAWNR